MGFTNDERGWIMAGMSGIACIVGASVICVDIIIRQFPGKRDWRIQDSNTFLSASLSLSFGVMLFSSLFSMLPSAKDSLVKHGLSKKAATWVMIACFLGGAVGIQVVSAIMHRFIPSHVVDCDHSHDEDEAATKAHEDEHSHFNGPANRTAMTPADHAHHGSTRHSHRSEQSLHGSEMAETSRPNLTNRTISTKSSFSIPLPESITRIASANVPSCTCAGNCYGYTDPCGTECFKNVNARGGFKAQAPRTRSQLFRPTVIKSATVATLPRPDEHTPLLRGVPNLADDRGAVAEASRTSTAVEDPERGADESVTARDYALRERSASIASVTSSGHHSQTDHHHHVPSNAFLSIGLQTSLAIALHKLPEGFITFATNHANPKLGVSVFLALFIHNITEGFALALPLYLAFNSRVKAMVISFFLGGLSQPLGAAIAAIWFKLAGDGKFQPDEGVYGAMFAMTAGIMASVALQLFSESLDLTHSRTLCMVGAFCGMGILGVSSALTA